MTDTPQEPPARTKFFDSLRGVAEVARCEDVRAVQILNELAAACEEVYGGMESVIHRAGDVVGGGQMCADCGFVIMDETDAGPRSVAIPEDDPEPMPPAIETGTPEHPEREITGGEPEMRAYQEAREAWEERMNRLCQPAFWPEGALVWTLYRFGEPTTFPRATGIRAPLDEEPLEPDERRCTETR